MVQLLHPVDCSSKIIPNTFIITRTVSHSFQIPSMTLFRACLHGAAENQFRWKLSHFPQKTFSDLPHGKWFSVESLKSKLIFAVFPKKRAHQTWNFKRQFPCISPWKRGHTNVPTIPLKLSIDFFYLISKTPCPLMAFVWKQSLRDYFGKKETLTTITGYKDWRNSMVLYSIRWPRIDLGLKIDTILSIDERERRKRYFSLPGLEGVRKALRRIAHLKEAVEEALVFSIYAVFLAVKSTNALLPISFCNWVSPPEKQGK